MVAAGHFKAACCRYCPEGGRNVSVAGIITAGMGHNISVMSNNTHTRLQIVTSLQSNKMLPR